MALHDDRTFVRHFSLVILFLAVMLIIFIVLSFVIVGVSGVESHSGYSYVQYMKNHPGATPPGATSSQAQAASAQGEASGQKVAATGNINGKTVWKAHCATCHATGLAGAPKIGDKAAWAPILKNTDLATLHHRSINGYTGSLGTMPPKGGATNLTDAQVKAAVNYMVGKSGGHPHQQGATEQKAAAGKTAQVPKVAAQAKTGGGSINGKSVWTAHCSVCHKTGIAGAPRIGDKAVWATIFKKTDHATLYKHAIEGFQGDRGYMPPKGGATNLSDAQVKAAVDYMIDKSGWPSH